MLRRLPFFGLLVFVSESGGDLAFYINTIVADPDPQDPYAFGPPGSAIWIR